MRQDLSVIIRVVFKICSRFRKTRPRSEKDLLADKLLFVDVRSKNAVIASQFANWRGNPPVEWNQVTITTKNR